jgi:hypothetical protein
MPRLEEDTAVWRYRVQDPSKFDRVKVDDVCCGVKVLIGRVRGSSRREIQSYIFEKAAGFKSQEQVRSWVEHHLKGEIQTLLDFKAWNEYRRRLVNVYMQISNVE